LYTGAPSRGKQSFNPAGLNTATELRYTDAAQMHTDKLELIRVNP
jgi:hypothetical protein